MAMMMQAGQERSPEQMALLEYAGADHAATLAVTVTGAFDVAMFSAIAARHVARHEILRSEGDGTAVAFAVERASRQADAASAPDHPFRIRAIEGAGPQWTLVFTAQRLVADERSLRALYEAMARDYVAEVVGTGQRSGAADDEEPLAYAQFVEWRGAVLADDDAQAGVDYWSSYIGDTQALRRRIGKLPAWCASGAVPVGATLTENPATNVPTVASPTRDMHESMVPAAVAEGMATAAASAGVTASVLLQAAWWALWARLHDYAPLLAGWQKDYRDDYEGMRGAMGCFGMVLPLKLDLAADMTLRHIARQVGTTLDMHGEMQDYACRMAGVPCPAAVFTALDWVDDYSVATGAGMTRMQCAAAHAAHPTSSLALQAEIDGTGHVRRISLSRRADVDGALAAALLDQYLTLLGAASGAAAGTDAAVATSVTLLTATAPATVAVWLDTPIYRLPIVSRRYRDGSLAWQGPRRDFGAASGAASLPGRIAQWARLRPDACALTAGDVTLTYRELEQRVAALARSIAAATTDARRPVALRMPRGGALVVGMLAAWRAGRMYLPLDTAWPDARCRDIITEAAPEVLLCLPDDVAAADAFKQHVRVLPCVTAAAGVPIEAGLADHADDAAKPQAALAHDTPAYVLYTSGSTGKPKGVVLGHGNLLNYVAAVSEALQLDTCARFALTSSVAADLGNTTLFGALFNGGCLAIADEAAMLDGALFAAFMDRQHIDCLKIVPSHLEALLEGYTGTLGAKLVLGGETASPRLLQRIRAQSPATRIYNHYGPTETTVGVLVHALDTPALDGGEGMPLTVPLANCRVYMRDASGGLAAPGHVGEVVIGGAQVCQGYLGEASAAAFIDDPCQPGERSYRTGDKARSLPGGGIRLLGRLDEQVKIRGYRIEPAEVERAVAALTDVRQAAVKAWETDNGMVLAAYVVAAQAGQAFDATALRNALGASLPDAMVPAYFIEIDALPRMANGKVDRHALPDPRAPGGQGREAEASVGGGGHARGDTLGATAVDASATGLERLLVKITSELLDRPVAPRADLFDLGFHSLLVIRLVSRLREALGVDVIPGVVFDNPTVESLAAAIGGGEKLTLS